MQGWGRGGGAYPAIAPDPAHDAPPTRRETGAGQARGGGAAAEFATRGPGCPGSERWVSGPESMGRKGRSKEGGEGNEATFPRHRLQPPPLKAWLWSGSVGTLGCSAPCTPAARAPGAWRPRSLSGSWCLPPRAAPLSFSSSSPRPLLSG